MWAETLRIGIIGLGQIARVQHVPAIAATPGLTLAAVANPVPVSVPDGVSLSHSLEAMLADSPDLDAVAICTPPQIRYGLAVSALKAGKHVLLEKPPAATPAEVAALAALAARCNRTLFTAWHSLFHEAVDRAREILLARGVAGMHMIWKEDVRKWHPGVDWFWQPGGMGTFDSGINAFSILVSVMPEPIFVREAVLMIPEGAQTPVSASLRYATPSHANGFTSEHSWDHTGPEIWTITWTLGDGGVLTLEEGGGVLKLDGETLVAEPGASGIAEPGASGIDEEYPRLYARFRDLIRANRSEVEFRPLQLVADAFMVARHVPVARFAS
jgi:D-galactose 1-dehydrogenase